MPKVITFDKGSKRRLKDIRWKISEIVSLASLAVLILGTTLWIVIGEIRHAHMRPRPPASPEIKPTEPPAP